MAPLGTYGIRGTTIETIVLLSFEHAVRRTGGLAAKAGAGNCTIAPERGQRLPGSRGPWDSQNSDVTEPALDPPPAGTPAGPPSAGDPCSWDVAVIGGGIVGLAAAYKLLRALDNARVAVLEKEPAVARHQSSHNSGVLHAGLSYRPGSLKARLAVDGIRQMSAFCRARRIPYEICGKLVVASDPTEVPILRELRERGERNGLRGLEWIEERRIREIEPHASGVAGLFVPEEGITDYAAVCDSLARAIAEEGGRVVTGAAVLGLRPEGRGWTLRTTVGESRANFLVNCAGLHADRVARMAGECPPVRIVPFRGQYYQLRAERESMVRNLIYPVPNPTFPFLGVHLTRTIGGGILAGPNAALALAREGYGKLACEPVDLWETLSFRGTWRFVARYPRLCWSEMWRTLSRRHFAAAVARLVPGLSAADLLPAGAGVRAQALLPSGEMLNDFAFLEGTSALHVLSAPSPGATASLAIGDEIVRRYCAARRGRAGTRPPARRDWNEHAY